MQADYSGQAVTAPARAGGRAMRFEWRPVGVRKVGSAIDNASKKAHLNGYAASGQQDRWYGFSTYFPATGMAPDSFPEIITQWHETPDFSLGENWRTPPAAMVVRNDQLSFGWKYDRRPVTPDLGQNLPSQGVSLGAVPKDRWVDFVFHIKWDPFGHGVVQVWMNGRQVADRTNVSVGYNDALTPFFCIGVYKYGSVAPYSQHSSRVIYFDEVRIGDGSAGYADVAPA